MLYFCGLIAPTKIPLKSPGLVHPTYDSWVVSHQVPIGSMYGIYAITTGVYKWQMLPYMAYMDPMGYEDLHCYNGDTYG